MSEHLDLFGLLRGELGNAEAIAAGQHLATCSTCQEELADAVVGHALLARASRTLGPETETSRPAPLGVLPPARRRRGALLAGAAAVVLALGATAAVWWHSDGERPGRGVEAALAPLSEAEPGDGSVRMVEDGGRTRMTVAVHDLPAATSGEFYYAWLLDPDTNKMLALGLVDPDTGATFELDDALVASYSAVDVSLETDDGDPQHSVTSVLRGTYEPDQITTTERNTP
jgi:hypothetical protein